MYGNHKIGLFKVCKRIEFEGKINFDIRPKLFLTYDSAYRYVLETFKRNDQCMPWNERYSFCYETRDNNEFTLCNSVKIKMILPFYLHIGREWL